MNSTGIILFALLLFFMSIHVASAMMMYQYLIQRGEKISIFLMRLKIFSAISKYRKATKKESGQTGYLFYVWVISVNLALTSFIIMVVLDILPHIHEYIIVIGNTKAASIFLNIFSL